jgi:hypothetical protein
MKRLKRTFTADERNLVFYLWKDGSIFTILRETGGIKPKPRHRNITHLTVSERE